ncbi:hypothetical protein BF49_7205 [Bradyrhizobium sp.]|nr:hypothetical protein BF49_7205 [Bradyrhizobium sp.]
MKDAVIPGRRVASNPESIEPQMSQKNGFRVRASRAPE